MESKTMVKRTRSEASEMLKATETSGAENSCQANQMLFHPSIQNGEGENARAGMHRGKIAKKLRNIILNFQIISSIQ